MNTKYAVFAIVFAVAVSGCSAPPANPDQNNQSSLPDMVNPIEDNNPAEPACPSSISIVSSRTSYAIGEDINLSVELRYANGSLIPSYQFKLNAYCISISPSYVQRRFNQTMLFGTGVSGLFSDTIVVSSIGYKSTHGIPALVGMNNYKVYPRDENCSQLMDSLGIIVSE